MRGGDGTERAYRCPSRRHRSAADGARIVAVARIVLLVIALAGITGGVWLAPHPPDGRILLAIGAVVLAFLLRLRFRTGGGVFFLAWGEAALIIGLYLVPAGWLPLTFATGVLVAAGIRTAAGVERHSINVPVAAASISLAATAGAAVSVAVADPYHRPLTPSIAVGMVLAALTYLLVTAVTASIVGRLRQQGSVLSLVRRTLQRKLPMFAGNIGVGAMVLVLAETDW